MSLFNIEKFTFYQGNLIFLIKNLIINFFQSILDLFNDTKKKKIKKKREYESYCMMIKVSGIFGQHSIFLTGKNRDKK